MASPGFESGTLNPWTCAAGTGSVVASPAHSGSHALAAAASTASTAQCSQTITVSSSHSYKLTGYVQGSYAYLGVSGTGTTDKSTWAPSAPSWTKLSVSFTTGANTHTVTVYTHGWYGQGTVYADDFTVS